MAGSITRKRIYLPADPLDGYRVLVDRLWPRGVRKSEAQLDLWLKEVAPSPDLRTWFDHREDRWCVFRLKYTEELAANAAFRCLSEIADARDLTLLYAAHDEVHNHAAVLEERLIIARKAAEVDHPSIDPQPASTTARC